MGGGGIRTCEGKNQQIYGHPRWPLDMQKWNDGGLDPRPANYKSAALTSWATSAWKRLQIKR